MGRGGLAVDKCWAVASDSSAGWGGHCEQGRQAAVHAKMSHALLFALRSELGITPQRLAERAAYRQPEGPSSPPCALPVVCPAERERLSLAAARLPE